MYKRSPTAATHVTAFITVVASADVTAAVTVAVTAAVAAVMNGMRLPPHRFRD